MGMVKTSSHEYPKRYLKEWLKQVLLVVVLNCCRVLYLKVQHRNIFAGAKLYYLQQETSRYGLSICNDNLETTKRAKYRLWIQASSTIPTKTNGMGDKRVGMSAYRDSEKWISKDCYSS
ncbi:hypothetical protein PHMEG_00022836 [Phytophthora megakarya]|uniref:Uncharacterized protein n=1 Tax=Phytophthora megakarya TaxID=4795 RepID=A0A225VI91_9STRA|nr:hypothetical protein PHMEG_00022836 [Phytophthora megakarya]